MRLNNSVECEIVPEWLLPLQLILFFPLGTKSSSFLAEREALAGPSRKDMPSEERKWSLRGGLRKAATKQPRK